MGRYTVGPSTVHLTGHAQASQPGELVEHDFSIAGPDGEHGPAREAALITAGALTPVTEEASRERPSARRRQDTDTQQEG